MNVVTKCVIPLEPHECCDKRKHVIPSESHECCDKTCDSKRPPCCFTVLIFVFNTIDHHFQVKVGWLVRDETCTKH